MYGNDRTSHKTLNAKGRGLRVNFVQGGETMIFSEWFEEFFKTYCEEALTFGCSQEYRIIYNKHYTMLYEMELDSIKPLHVQQCLNTAKNYSSSRQRKVYFLLHRIFEQAIFNDYANENPTEKVKPPRKIKKNLVVFEPEQIEKLFDVRNAESRMLLLELWTGLRRGELLALHWDNIDIEKGCINVCQTLVSGADGQFIRNSTKSNKDRFVPLNDFSKSILLEIRSCDSDKGFLFKCEGKDSPMSFRTYHDRYRAYFKGQQAKYPDLPYMTPHKLRHTYATYILQSGADIETVKMLLGHSDIATTALYIHSNFRRMQEAVNHLNFT